jgi:hypothetical protein
MEHGKKSPLKAIKFHDIPPALRRTILPAHMFLKDKFKADGTYDKCKARLVLGGDQQDSEMVGDTFSPTVNPISVMTQIAITSSKRYNLNAYDIKKAFLMTNIRKGERIFIRIRPDIVQHWVQRLPSRKTYVNKDGCMYFELNCYMYGMQEASHEFNIMLSQIIQNIGFQTSIADPCVYTMNTEDGLMILSTHVDDVLLTSPSLRTRMKVEKALEKHFELVKQEGQSISYLGMVINTDIITGNISVTQSGFANDLLKKNGYDHAIPKPPKSPTAVNFLETDSTSPPCNKNKFLSLIMSLMYLARFTRPDILFAVSYLATKSAQPSEADMKKAQRIVKFIAGTKDRGIVFDARVKLEPKFYADASHALYHDGHGQAGIIITLGSAPVLSRSFKIKAVTRSSSESELYALEEISTYVIWYHQLLNDLQLYFTKPSIVFQDNQSTIIMAVQGGNFKRTKHILVKESYIKERILKGDIILKYLPTNDMIADILTKPLTPSQLDHLLNLCSMI